MKITREVKIGLFAIITILLMVFVINFLKGSNIFKSNLTFYSKYESLDALNKSASVFIRGFKSGSITDIQYSQEDDKYIVEVEVNKDINIPSDSFLEIYSADIMGTKAVRVIFGESDIVANSGDTLRSRIEPDMISNLIGELVSAKKDIETLIVNLNTTVLSINDIVGEENKTYISSILQKMERSIKNVEFITKKVKKSSPELNQMISNLNLLIGNLNNSSEILNIGLENINNITEEVKEAELKETIASLRSLLEKMQDPNGSLGKTLTTDSLHNSVLNLTKDLNSLIIKIEENPKKYMKLSIF